MRFPERIGKKPIKTELPLESMDQDLRNALWNIFTVFVLEPARQESCSPSLPPRGRIDQTRSFFPFFRSLWADFFKRRLDRMPDTVDSMHGDIEEWFFKCEWYDVYDLMEYTAGTLKSRNTELFKHSCNAKMEGEMGGWRFIGDHIAPITNEQELEEIEKAILEARKGPFPGIKTHLESALSMLSDKKKPDYRNSVKESISAVEALCRLIAKDPRATLGDALNIIADKIGLHPALRKGYQNIYGYTSDADAIRHGNNKISEVDLEFARYMVVSCSAFINYLIAKSEKAGIDLSSS